MTDKVVQYGIVRSGSTLCYMLLKEFFSNVEKRHKLNKNLTSPVVITYRDFRDSTLSQFRVIRTKQKNSEFKFVNKENYEEEFLEDNFIELLKNITPNQVKRISQNIIENQISELDNHVHIKNKLILKYEDFVDDIGFILNRYESFFEIEIHNKQELIDKYHINKIKKITDKLGSFNIVDQKTHLHGRHIDKGESGIWKNLQEETLEAMNEIFEPYLLRYGYKV